jgi:hypothetical protein
MKPKEVKEIEKLQGFQMVKIILKDKTIIKKPSK